jgi:hypothetical protein
MILFTAFLLLIGKMIHDKLWNSYSMGNAILLLNRKECGFLRHFSGFPDLVT